jgi:hypothetical protein
MKYYNVKTRQYADELPVPTVPFAVKAGVVQGTANAASIAEWQRAQGWRVVKLCQTAGEGWRVDEWMHTDDDGINCNLIIAHAADVAKEQADAAEAQAAAVIAARQAKLDNFEARDIELMEFALRLRNYNISAQYQVTLEQAKEIWRKVVDRE